jgi:hypothetical protein
VETRPRSIFTPRSLPRGSCRKDEHARDGRVGGPGARECRSRAASFNSAIDVRVDRSFFQRGTFRSLSSANCITAPVGARKDASATHTKQRHLDQVAAVLGGTQQPLIIACGTHGQGDRRRALRARHVRAGCGVRRRRRTGTRVTAGRARDGVETPPGYRCPTRQAGVARFLAAPNPLIVSVRHFKVAYDSVRSVAQSSPRGGAHSQQCLPVARDSRRDPLRKVRAVCTSRGTARPFRCAAGRKMQATRGLRDAPRCKKLGMVPKHFVRRASLAIALAITGCTITTSSSDSCSIDPTVTGCTQGSSGYSCTGSTTPVSSVSPLVCSPGVEGSAGATLFCCVSGGAVGTTCAPDVTVSNCADTTQGYSCTGSDTPEQDYSSLSCGAGISGNAGSTLYCCTSSAGADGGNDAGAVGSDSGGNIVPDSTSDTADQTDGGADAGTCGITADTGNSTCDQCVDSMCCDSLVACGTADDAGADDAGASACEQLLQCTLACLTGNPDAGVPAGTLTDCQALCSPSYSTAEQQNANALLQCLTNSCSQPCQ